MSTQHGNLTKTVTNLSSGANLTYFTDAQANQSLANPSAVNASGQYYLKATTNNCASELKAVRVTIKPLPQAVSLTSNGPLSNNQATVTLAASPAPAAGVTYSFSQGPSRRPTARPR